MAIPAFFPPAMEALEALGGWGCARRERDGGKGGEGKQ